MGKRLKEGKNKCFFYCIFSRDILSLEALHFQVIAPIFIGEIASPSIRGRLGTMFQVFVVLGIFLMYVIGNYYQWKTLAILCSAVPFFIILALSFLRDSPASYMLRGRPELARKAMVWLRNTADIDEEMYALQVRTMDISISITYHSTVALRSIFNRCFVNRNRSSIDCRGRWRARGDLAEPGTPSITFAARVTRQSGNPCSCASSSC